MSKIPKMNPVFVSAISTPWAQTWAISPIDGLLSCADANGDARITLAANSTFFQDFIDCSLFVVVGMMMTFSGLLIGAGFRFKGGLFNNQCKTHL